MTKTIDHTKAYEAWRRIMDEDVLEDRREYEIDQLETMYGLDNEDAGQLHILIQDSFEPRGWATEPAQDLKDMLGEAEHEGFDGWSDSDRFVIMAFLADISKALRSS